MVKKVIMTASLSGGVNKTQNPAIPYTPAELAEEAGKAYRAGAAVGHVHAHQLPE